MKHTRSVFFACILLALAASACVPTAPAGEPAALPKEVTVVVVVTATGQQPATEPVLVTPTSSPIPVTGSESIVTPQPGPLGTTPRCTALKNVNLRSGPGTVFDPPENVVRQNNVVIPEGFTSRGFPDGAWVFVALEGTDEKGWVSADPSLVTCNVDITTLPAVAAPPTPAALRVRSSKPEGSPNGIDGTVISDPKILLQFIAIGPGGEKDGDHIEKISFTIFDQNGNTVLEHTEQNEPFCIFGGDNSCAPWPKQDFSFVWGNSENRVESGEYQALIVATTDAETGNIEGNWSFTINIEVP
jgi:hypothetical protein